MSSGFTCRQSAETKRGRQLHDFNPRRRRAGQSLTAAGNLILESGGGLPQVIRD
jgi:hypothetical protein